MLQCVEDVLDTYVRDGSKFESCDKIKTITVFATFVVVVHYTMSMN